MKIRMPFSSLVIILICISCGCSPPDRGSIVDKANVHNLALISRINVMNWVLEANAKGGSMVPDQASLEMLLMMSAKEFAERHDPGGKLNWEQVMFCIVPEYWKAGGSYAGANQPLIIYLGHSGAIGYFPNGNRVEPVDFEELKHDFSPLASDIMPAERCKRSTEDL